MLNALPYYIGASVGLAPWGSPARFGGWSPGGVYHGHFGFPLLFGPGQVFRACRGALASGFRVRLGMARTPRVRPAIGALSLYPPPLGTDGRPSGPRRPRPGLARLGQAGRLLRCLDGRSTCWRRSINRGQGRAPHRGLGRGRPCLLGTGFPFLTRGLNLLPPPLGGVPHLELPMFPHLNFQGVFHGRRSFSLTPRFRHRR